MLSPAVCLIRIGRGRRFYALRISRRDSTRSMRGRIPIKLIEQYCNSIARNLNPINLGTLLQILSDP